MQFNKNYYISIRYFLTINILQMNEEAVSRERQLEIIFEASNDIIFLISIEPGPRFRFSSVNKAFLTATGLQKEQVEGKLVDEIIPAPSLHLVLARYRQAIDDRQTVEWEETSEYPAGTKTGTVNITPVFNDQSACTMLVGTVHDITARKKAEQEKEHVHHLLNERVKEMTLMYNASQLFQSEVKTTEAVLQELLSMLPSGWQYPDITEARIVLGEKLYLTPGFSRSVDRLSANFIITGDTAGIIEVAYSEKKPTETEGPFLAEERKMVNILAGMLSDYFARKAAAGKFLKEKELSESIINSLPGIFYLFDNTGKYLRWNKNHETVPGYTTEDMQKAYPLDFFDEDEKTLISERIGKVFTEGYADVEAKFMGKNGQKNPYYFNGIAIEYEGRPCLMGVAFDISERKKFIEALQKSEANLHTIFDTTDTIYTLLDNNFQVISFNQRAFDFIKNELHQELKLSVDLISCFPKDKQLELYDNMKKVLSGEHISYESKYPQKKGTVHWYHVRMFPIRNSEGKIFGMMVAVSDITEKKLLQQEIMDQKVQEQKKMTRAVLNAQERERNKIGQELHDNVNQILVGSKMYLGLLNKGAETNPALIQQSIGLIDSAINEIRSLTREQVTPQRKIDLKDLIQSLVDNVNAHTVVKAKLIYNTGTVPVNDDLKLNIYRIMQEGMNNILKHAAAQNAVLTVKALHEHLYITISDDGKGFDARHLKTKGIGIANMFNRVETYNGTIIVGGNPGYGCTIEVIIPV